MPRAGGAAAAAPADDERHRDVVLGWIYEFLSRNRMEEAKEVLVKSAEKRFHVSSDTFLPHTDPVSVLQELLDVGEFDKALFEFELQLADYKADVGEELYAETLQGIKLQSVIQVLHADGGKNSFEDFQQRAKECFPEGGKKKGAQETTSSELRAELLATKKKDVDKLLAKYSTAAFKTSTAPFWRAVRSAQKPTTLQKIVNGIESGAIPWEDEDEEHVASLPASVAADPTRAAPAPAAPSLAVPDSTIPAPASAVAAGNSAEGASSKAASRVVAPLQSAGSTGDGSGSRSGKLGTGFVMSAWELREALDPNHALQDDYPDWSNIHNQTHPEVAKYLAERRTKEEMRVALSKLTESKSALSDAELGSSDDDVEVVSMPKRRKVEAPGKKEGRRRAGVGGSANVDMSASMNAGDTEEEDDEEPKRRGGRGNEPKAASAKDQALIDEAHEKSKRLREMGDDPLKAAVAGARSAKEGGPKIKSYDPATLGRSIVFDEDEDEDEDDSPKLQLASVDTSFKPRRDILADIPTSVSNRGGRPAPSGSVHKDPSKKRKWTPQEEEALRKGVKEHGVGFWKKICENSPALKNRTQVDCKDKWRNLQKKAGL